MNVRALRRLAPLAATLTLALSACTSAPTPTNAVIHGVAVARDAAGAPTGVLRLGVSVRDASGEAMNTRVSALGIDIVGASVARCATTTPDTGRLATALMLDESGSLSERDPTGARFASVRTFVETMARGEVAAVARFSSAATASDGLRAAELLTAFTTDEIALLAAIDASALASGTGPLFDAAHDAVTLLATRGEPRKVGVIIVDGADLGSTTTAAAANAHARANGVALHAFGFGDASVAELDALVAGTGGYRDVIAAGDPRDASDLLDGLRGALAASACVSVTLPTAPTAGERVSGTLTFTADNATVLSAPFDVRF